MKSIKSLIITTGNFPNGGCTANFIRVFAKGLIEHNVHVEVILLKGNQDDFKINDKANNDLPGYRFFIFRIQPYGFFMKLLQFILIVKIFPWYLLFRIILRKYKIVYLYGVEYPYLTVPYLLLCKILKVKCIRIITDFYSDKSVANTWWRRPKWFFYKAEIKYIDRYFNGIIVLSDFLKEKLIKAKVKPDRILKVLHFIDFKYFRFTEGGSAKKDQTLYSIGYIGTLSNLNGIDILLEAIRILSGKMNNIQLLIIGDLNYEKGTVEKINALRQDTKLNIVAPGYLSLEELKKYYQLCDILINPRISSLSADAGFPTKVGEYMSTGKPVIVTSVGYFKNPEFQKETGVLVIDPDSPEALADSIRKIIYDYALYFEKSKINLDWVRNNLDYYHNSKKVLDLIMNDENISTR